MGINCMSMVVTYQRTFGSDRPSVGESERMSVGNANSTLNDEKRRFERVPLDGRLTYRYNQGENAAGTWRDLSRSGARIQLGRYLRPGRRVMLIVASDDESDEPAIELKAQIVWCRPVSDSHDFEAGLRIFHDQPDTVDTLTAIVDDGC